MIRLAVAAALLASASSLAAQIIPPSAKVAELRDTALKDELAYEITEGLTTEVGQRLAGTEAEARGRTWSVAKLKRLGFSNVRIDPFTMPVWVR